MIHVIPSHASLMQGAVLVTLTPGQRQHERAREQSATLSNSGEESDKPERQQKSNPARKIQVYGLFNRA